MARTKSTKPKKNDSHRGHREGSIFQMSNGVWKGQLQVGFKPDGSRRFITKKSKDKQAILDWMIENQNNVKNNTFIEPTSISLEQWLWNWMAVYKLNSVADNTYARYLSLINNHILPEINKIKLKDLTKIQLQNIYNRIMDKGISYEAMKHVHTVFNQALQCAVDENLISQNCSVGLNKGKKEVTEEVHIFTREQQKRIIDNLPFNPLGVLIRTGIGTGARLGELLGISWDDIDFENNIIHIRNGLKKNKVFSEDGKKIIKHYFALGTLKTKKSRRDIPINEATVSLLRKYKLVQRSFIEDENVVTEMVFLNSKGNYCDPSKVRKAYKKYLASIEVPYIKFHALRHTFASRILEENVPPKVAQELLGHSTVSITMDIYSHVLPEVKREAMERIKGIV